MKTPHNSDSVQFFIDIGQSIANSPSVEQFHQAMRQGNLAIHDRLVQDPQGVEAQSLRQAFQKMSFNFGHKLALQLCAMPSFEKPSIPETTNPAEFLWLFSIPITIQLADATADSTWPIDALPAEQLLELLENSNRINDSAQLGLFSSLYSRNDFLGWGPENMAIHALNAELHDLLPPPPLPLSNTGTLLGGALLFYALGIARVPVGTSTLLQSQRTVSDLQAMSYLIKRHLHSKGVPVMSVSVAPPCPATSSCFMANHASLAQLKINCQHARKELSIVAAEISQPLPGYLEIVGYTEAGAPVNLTGFEPCGEPFGLIQPVLAAVLEQSGLKVLKPKAPTYLTSAQMH